MQKHLKRVCVMVILFALTSAHGENLPIDIPHTETVTFTENCGQWDDRVHFKANVNGTTMWFTDDGVYYHFARRIVSGEHTTRDVSCMQHDKQGLEPAEVEQLLIKTSFVGANQNLDISGESITGYKCNYYRGNDPDLWRTDVPSYEAVVFHGIYSGIDLKYYGNDKQLEYDFIVAPGADPDQIMVQYDGAESVDVNDLGELVVTTKWGEVIELRPYVYQAEDGKRMPLDCEYTMLADNAFGFELSDKYNPQLAVVIDPVVTYGSYLGGSTTDYAYGLAVDNAGSIYISGETWSTDFPLENPYDNSLSGVRDGFVTKFNPGGGSLAYSTYIGGTVNGDGYAPSQSLGSIVVDGSGNLYAGGQSDAMDFPVTGDAFQPTIHDDIYTDAVIVKLDDAGQLVYGSYFGGNHDDGCGAYHIDDSGCLYIKGGTVSWYDFPLVNAYDSTHNGGIAFSCPFISKFNPGLGSLAFSTYWEDVGTYSMAVDDYGNVYVAGRVSSPDTIPTTAGAYQENGGALPSGYVTKFHSSGTSLVYSTYIGNAAASSVNAMTIDSEGYVYIAGYAYDGCATTPGAYDNAAINGYDIYVAKLNQDGSDLAYATYIGPGDNDYGYGIELDSERNAYLFCYVNAPGNFPILNAFDSTSYASQVLVKLNSDGTDLIFSSFLPGPSAFSLCNLVYKPDGNLYLSGRTNGTGLILANPYDASYNGDGDAFVMIIEDDSQELIKGDVDGSGGVDIDDIVYLIAYVFQGGPEPIPIETGEVNCSGAIDIDDIVYLISYVFQGGYAPCDPDGNGVPDC